VRFAAKNLPQKPRDLRGRGEYGKTDIWRIKLAKYLFFQYLELNRPDGNCNCDPRVRGISRGSGHIRLGGLEAAGRRCLYSGGRKVFDGEDRIVDELKEYFGKNWGRRGLLRTGSIGLG